MMTILLFLSFLLLSIPIRGLSFLHAFIYALEFFPKTLPQRLFHNDCIRIAPNKKPSENNIFIIIVIIIDFIEFI